MSIVIDNLKEAINGEYNAKRKYKLFSEKAKNENLNKVAHVFKAISFAESIHIKNHLKALSIITKSSIEINPTEQIDDNILKGNINDTISNLEDAIKGENYESKIMYRKFVKNAANNEKNVAELSFSLARSAEKIHSKIYSNYLKDLKKKRHIVAEKIYVCKICGNVEFGEPPKKCPVCDHSSRFFLEIR
ncbi:MAG: rubrerythrin family protein [Candidatus Lokiarchaeota archaeon]|nr:rubrerythrin family protein [Candidatus Lokiarchaeota archaeon]